VNRRSGGITPHNGILIAGGYGVVGQRIAADLSPDYEAIVAGRHLAQANVAAAAIGHGVRGRELDVNDDDSIASALDGIAVIVSCIDQPRRGLLHAAIDRGLAYTDTTGSILSES
jgi:saccharopine dehydrogenase (NAD+, L-lysine-forming)